ncbi:MAG: hypothetical protein L3K08_03750, partial [Thermoplasmata archaeon]|nr:hypothetical protein [Thermoplasmata archaeon]
GVQADRTAWDADQVLTVSATISGGTGVDERCEWFVNETAFGPPQGCDLPVNLTGVAGSPTTAEVKVTDSTGSVANSSVVAYTPQEAPIATLAQTAADGTALRNAGGLEF